MICPSCGENNSANFRFCGMCGTSLEPRRPAGAPRTVGASDAPRTLQPTIQNDAVEARTPTTAGAARGSQPTIGSYGTSGPSFLGLNQPFREGRRNDSSGDTSPNESFAGLDSFFETEEPGVSARGIIVLIVLLVALGVAGWWAYTQFNSQASIPGAKSATAAQTAAAPSGAETSADSSTSNPNPPDASPSASASSSPSSSPNPSSSQPAATVAPPESANSTPPPAVSPVANPKADRNPAAPPKPTEGTRAAGPNHPAHEQKLARAEEKPAPRLAAAAPASGDKGDPEFKKGEAYLYGRGMQENCDLAIKNLKAASAKQNAKARGAFGTMYATGHCVPRDLPTSYSWFAQALHADSNNQILEKDLTAVWNQMTPPERQMAARNKQ